MIKYLTFCLIVVLSLSAIAKDSQFIPYTIKKGDNVSELLAKHSKRPLYGKNMWVDKILKLNRLDENSAKKLEPGDMIILPVQAKIFMAKSYQDKVKVLQSSWQKSLRTKYLSPQKNNFLFTASYFNRNYQLSSQNVKIQQGLQAHIEYKMKDLSYGKRFHFNPKASVTAYSQNNADFSQDNQLIAEFTPSYLTSFQYELEDKQTQFSLAPTIAYENFSLLEEINDDYNVSNLDVTWAGAELARYFHFDHNTYRLSANYLVGNNYNATRTQFLLRGFIEQHYIAEVFYHQSRFELQENSSVTDAGFSLGYRF